MNDKPTRPILRYHGGKWRIAPWVISHFPAHKVYVEPYGGAGSILLQKTPSIEEVYNDIDSDVVNVFRVARDPAKAMRLQELLELTPYARQELEEAYAQNPCDEIEQARRTIVRAFMGQGSGGATDVTMNGWRSRRKEGNWPVKDWRGYPQELQFFFNRLRFVTIECREALDLLQRYDAPDTLFYVDPPYLANTRANQGQNVYRYEMTDEDHVRLAERLHSLSGMVVLSGYDSPLYRDLFKGWAMSCKPTHATNLAKRVECLWISPTVREKGLQHELWHNRRSDPSTQEGAVHIERVQ